MEKTNLFKLADNSIMYLWLIDRIASGYNFEIIRELYKQDFGFEISEDEFNKFKEKYELDIVKRYDLMRKEVYDSGTFGKLTSIADNLYNRINDKTVELSPKEIAQLSDTLRKYLETLGTFGKAKSETKKVINNSYLILESFESEGIISINDKRKLKFLCTGEEDDGTIIQ